MVASPALAHEVGTPDPVVGTLTDDGWADVDHKNACGVGGSAWETGARNNAYHEAVDPGAECFGVDLGVTEPECTEVREGTWECSYRYEVTVHRRALGPWTTTWYAKRGDASTACGPDAHDTNWGGVSPQLETAVRFSCPAQTVVFTPPEDFQGCTGTRMGMIWFSARAAVRTTMQATYETELVQLMVCQAICAHHLQ